MNDKPWRPWLLLYFCILVITAALLCAIYDENSSLSMDVRSAYLPDTVSGGIGRLDFTQAEVMLDFLNSLAGGEEVTSKIDPLLQCIGTKLVIRQMNLARKVSEDQYRTLLNGLISDRLPVIEPVDSSARAAMGVKGLIDNVWPVLIWVSYRLVLIALKHFEKKELE